MKKIWTGILLLCLGFQVDALWSMSVEKQLQKAQDLMFKTSRGPKQLQGALDIYESLYKQMGLLKSPASLLLEYAYTIYYKASYTYPPEGEKGHKEAIPERLVLYSRANDFIDFLLKNENRLAGNSQRAELYFVGGMIKGEIASLNSSPFMIIRSRKLLEQALQVDNNFRQGAVYLSLGRIYTKTPRILFGSKDKALTFIKHAIEDFSPPSIIGFYFKMDAIADGRQFSKLSATEKKDILEAALNGLKWEQKRRGIPPYSKNAITPEESDSAKMIRQRLAQWGNPTSIQGLEKQIAQMKS